MVISAEDSVPFAGREYFAMFALMAFARVMDLLSTWVATPRMELEGNPIAKWLGWKWGALVNIILVVVLSMWPLSAIVVATASVLVAARNFQSAWLMRTMGEDGYRTWYLKRMAETPISLYLLCLAGNSLLTAAVGAALVVFTFAEERYWPVPLGIGMGMIAYSVAVVIFTLLSVWRIRRRRRYDAHQALPPMQPDVPASPDPGPPSQ